jgi:hypothetical protein
VQCTGHARLRQIESAALGSVRVVATGAVAWRTAPEQCMRHDAVHRRQGAPTPAPAIHYGAVQRTPRACKKSGAVLALVICEMDVDGGLPEHAGDAQQPHAETRSRPRSAGPSQVGALLDKDAAVDTSWHVARSARPVLNRVRLSRHCPGPRKKCLLQCCLAACPLVARRRCSGRLPYLYFVGWDCTADGDSSAYHAPLLSRASLRRVCACYGDLCVHWVSRLAAWRLPSLRLSARVRCVARIVCGAVLSVSRCRLVTRTRFDCDGNAFVCAVHTGIQGPRWHREV